MKTLMMLLIPVVVLAQPFNRCLNCHGEFADAKVVAEKRAKITEYILNDKMPPGVLLGNATKQNLLAEVNRIAGTAKKKSTKKRKKK